MNVLVTGASGFVGKYTVRELIRHGHRVFALVRRRSAERHLNAMGATPLRGDLSHLPQTAKLPPLDAVIHLAGVIKVKTNREFYEINTKGTEKLIRWLPKMALMHFIHVSSISARGPGDAKTAGPVSHYGRSKLESENIVRDLLDPGQTTVLRPPVIYGPGDESTLPLFRMFARGHFLAVDPAQRLSFAYVEDVARILAALVPMPSTEIIYPEDGSKGYALTDVIQTASGVFDKKIRMHVLPKPVVGAAAVLTGFLGRVAGLSPLFSYDKFLEMRQTDWTCDNAGWFETLNLPEPVKLKAGMARARTWYKEQGWI